MFINLSCYLLIRIYFSDEAQMGDKADSKSDNELEEQIDKWNIPAV